MGWMNISHAQEARRRGKAAQSLYKDALGNKYKPNGKTEEVIGLVDPTLTHITTDAVPGTLTQTTFDTTSRADSAQILLTNSTGASRVIIAAWIRGKPVTRLSGTEGYLHDKFVDYEAQARDGDITFETGNNFVVTADQVNKLADYEWKLNKVKKHIYVLSLVGFQSWYEPGEWYTMDIGVEGTAENIYSTVECFDVRCSIQAGGAGYTSVSFREVEENWKFDSNEVARMIASGGFNRRPSQNVVTVAAQYYSGYADYYCDGTADQTEINNAITYLNQTGGGTVHLAKGNYNITSAITMLDDIRLEGEGDATCIIKNCNDYAIAAIGTSTTSVTNISLVALKATRASADTNVVPLIYYNYADNTSFDNITVDDSYNDGIVLDMCDKSNIGPNNKIRNCSERGIALTGSTGIITTNNFISGCAVGYESYPSLLTERVSNGDCESITPPLMGLTTSATLTNCTFARSNEQAYDGSYSYKITASALSATCRIGDAGLATLQMATGKSYIFSTDIYIPTALSATIYMYCLANTSTFYPGKSRNQYGQWYRMAAICEAIPSSATTGSVYWRWDNNATTSYTYVDDVHVYEFDAQNSGCQIVNNYIGSSAIGISIINNNMVIQNNQVIDCSQQGIEILAGYNNVISNNKCYNNGDDAGLANTNGDNFYDGGVDTQVSG